MNPLKPLHDKFTEQCDGNLTYRQGVALARIILALKDLTADLDFPWETIVALAEDLPGWQSEGDKVNV